MDHQSIQNLSFYDLEWRKTASPLPFKKMNFFKLKSERPRQERKATPKTKGHPKSTRPCQEHNKSRGVKAFSDSILEGFQQVWEHFLTGITPSKDGNSYMFVSLFQHSNVAPWRTHWSLRDFAQSNSSQSRLRRIQWFYILGDFI